VPWSLHRCPSGPQRKVVAPARPSLPAPIPHRKHFVRLSYADLKPTAWPGVRGRGLVCLASHAAVLLAGVAFAEEAPPASPSSEEIRQGIEKSVRTHFQAFNEENMEKLLALVSQEVPSRQRFITAVDSAWSVNDTYTVLEGVEVLDDSDVPGSQFEYPYATVRITQTVLDLRVNDERTPVFRRKCRKGDREPVEIATQLGILSSVETSSAEVLFKHEDGEWKLVIGLTEPVRVGTSAGAEQRDVQGVPAYQRIKVSGSVFK